MLLATTLGLKKDYIITRYIIPIENVLFSQMFYHSKIPFGITPILLRDARKNYTIHKQNRKHTFPKTFSIAISQLRCKHIITFEHG